MAKANVLARPLGRECWISFGACTVEEAAVRLAAHLEVSPLFQGGLLETEVKVEGSPLPPSLVIVEREVRYKVAYRKETRHG